MTNNNHHENNNNSHIESPNPAPNQQHPLNQLYENVVNAVLSSGSTVENLSDESRHRVWLELVNYETRHSRRLEEKELAIGELKKSLCDLTEKRFRTHLQQHPNESDAAESSGNAPPPLSNIEFMLDEKEAHVRELLKDLDDKSAEILKLKQTIKDQDLIILSHNTNIYVCSCFFLLFNNFINNYKHINIHSFLSKIKLNWNFNHIYVIIILSYV